MSQGYNISATNIGCSSYSGNCGGLESIAHSSSDYTSSSLSSSSESYSGGLVAYSISSSFGSSSANGAYHISMSANVLSSTMSPSSGANYSTSSTNYSFSKPQYNIAQAHAEYHFSPEVFLKPGKEGMFVGKAEEIREHIETTFHAVTRRSFPSDIKISICDEKEFQKIAPSPGTLGLSINRSSQGLLSEIFVLNGSLARVMLTIGHEIGHVLTTTLNSAHDEEAKAYAFSLAWMNKIQQEDIARLGDSFITENPAINGLHNVAFNFVQKMVKSGLEAWTIYRQLVFGELQLPLSYL